MACTRIAGTKERVPGTRCKKHRDVLGGQSKKRRSAQTDLYSVMPGAKTVLLSPLSTVPANLNVSACGSRARRLALAGTRRGHNTAADIVLGDLSCGWVT